MSVHDLIVRRRHVLFGRRRFACSVGRGGVTSHKLEGDGATPRGILHITQLFYRADRIPPPAPWAIAIGPQDIWCDAPTHPAYNSFAQRPLNASHERLYRADPMYDIILNTDWNWPNPQAGKGSAIFIHAWRRRGAPTAGCIALARADVYWIAQRAAPNTRILIDI